jgi:hypothetical protein
MAKPAAGTQALPKATVQLAKGTQPMARPTPAANVPAKRPVEESFPLEEEKDPEAGLPLLAIICTVCSLALMGVTMLGSDEVFFANPGETSSFMVPPAEVQKWEKPSDSGDGTHVSTFNSTLKEITSRYE